MTRRYALIGNPVSQSLSPAIHGYWYKKHAIDAAYDAVAIQKGDLANGVARLIDKGYAGWNVTIPHKVAMINLCDTLDAAARAVGAVNTVYFRDGAMVGSNTDSVGAMMHLDQTCPGWAKAVRAPVILGAGGAARAIAHGLRQNGIETYRLVSRSAPLEGAFPGAVWVPWAARQNAVEAGDLIIQTTPLGMAGQGGLEISLAGARPEAIIYDIVYKPLHTALILDAQAQGMRTVTGLGMLLHQARAAFDLWFGFAPDVEDGLMREIGF